MPPLLSPRPDENSGPSATSSFTTTSAPDGHGRPRVEWLPWVASSLALLTYRPPGMEWVGWVAGSCLAGGALAAGSLAAFAAVHHYMGQLSTPGVPPRFPDRASRLAAAVLLAITVGIVGVYSSSAARTAARQGEDRAAECIRRVTAGQTFGADGFEDRLAICLAELREERE